MQNATAATVAQAVASAAVLVRTIGATLAPVVPALDAAAAAAVVSHPSVVSAPTMMGTRLKERDLQQQPMLPAATDISTQQQRLPALLLHCYLKNAKELDSAA
jgi:hypothetical protein